MSDPRIAGLRSALAADPGNAALSGVLADLLVEAGEPTEAMDRYETARAAGAATGAQLLRAAGIAMDLGDLPAAGRMLQAAAGLADGPALDAARGRLVAVLAGAVDAVRPSDEEVEALLPEPDAPTREPAEPEAVRFTEVAGNDEVKTAISRAIILPFQRPDLYAAYGRRAGGGVLLYGPPGCGKTLLARATAGECGVPFFPVRIEDVLSPYIGEAERTLHELFEDARSAAPCVVFLDEVDALAYSRARRAGAAGRSLVSVLLQELDGFATRNDGVLVLAASNTPWDVDDALLRPGRFDRRIFVPPPDEAARAHLFAALLARRPADRPDIAGLAKGTELFSGADIAAVVEWAADEAIDASVGAGAPCGIRPEHLEAASRRVRPSTVDWLLAARNHAEFANADGRYDELSDYLRRRPVRKLLG